MSTFVALDFETADYYPDSACAIGLVQVTNGKIKKKLYHLIRPPRKEFIFTELHGIAWEDVRSKPTFGEVWPEIRSLLRNADFVAAHNASFDSRVLLACCAMAGVHQPSYRFICTVRLARSVWNIYPTKLNNVCDYLDIELNHHNAMSDAEACARIIIAAQKTNSPI